MPSLRSGSPSKRYVGRQGMPSRCASPPIAGSHCLHGLRMCWLGRVKRCGGWETTTSAPSTSCWGSCTTRTGRPSGYWSAWASLRRRWRTGCLSYAGELPAKALCGRIDVPQSALASTSAFGSEASVVDVGVVLEGDLAVCLVRAKGALGLAHHGFVAGLVRSGDVGRRREPAFEAVEVEGLPVVEGSSLKGVGAEEVLDHPSAAFVATDLRVVRAVGQEQPLVGSVERRRVLAAQVPHEGYPPSGPEDAGELCA